MYRRCWFQPNYPIATEQHRISWRELPGFFASRITRIPFASGGANGGESSNRIYPFCCLSRLAAVRYKLQQQRSQAANPFATNLRFHHPKTVSLCSNFSIPEFSRALISSASNHQPVWRFQPRRRQRYGFNGGFATFNSFRIRGDQGHFGP